MSRWHPSIEIARRAVQGVFLFAAATILLMPLRAEALLTNVDEATDICPVTANPCSITQTVETVPGAVLDFGDRAVSITGGGMIDAGVGNVTIRCGQLTVSTSGTAISLKGPDGFGGSLGGVGTVEARRRCSGNTALLCTRDSTCSTAGAGICSVGNGNVNLSGKVIGSADEPGAFFVRAAGDVQIHSTVACSGTSLESDGGSIDIVAGGSIVVDAKLEVTSSSLGGGGDLGLQAGLDLTITDFLDATGGDFDGGFIDISAGRDITISQDVNVNSTSGEGYGGELAIDAGRHLIIDGGSGTNRLTLTSDGHMSAENFGGDGGSQDYYSGGDIHLGRFVKISADGAPPDGYGETVTFDAGGDILLEADITIQGLGGFSGGGELDLFANGDVEITVDSSIDADGTEGGGGEVGISSRGDLTFAGTVSASGGGGGFAGAVGFDSGATFVASGDVLVNGATSAVAGGEIEVLACHINLLSGSSFDNRLTGGVNRFISREQFTAGSGSSVSTVSPGQNRIEYRTTAKPPVVGGGFSPAPVLTLRPVLLPCPICGNGQIEAGETCDDGNTSGGDGCSAACQNEGCVADTPGYPTVALCDDGDQCSADSCNNATSHCQHSSSCDDGIACTVDGCIGTTCTHTPQDALCDDGSECSDNQCNATTGCVVVPLAGTCDDGLYCNGSDACGGGSCSVHSGSTCVGLPECQDGCNEAADVCGSPFGTACTDDGNVCTDDVCDGLGACISIPNSAACSDGIFCNGTERCTEGTCSLHTGNPCNPTRTCAATCVEAALACQTPAFVPCADDTNVCTDDYCDGSGSCIHVDNSAPCDDDDFCTSADQCAAGACSGTPGVEFSTARLLVGVRSGPDNDLVLIKSVQPLASLNVVPSDVGMRLKIRDDTGNDAYESIIPAAAITNIGGRGTTFKFKDTNGLIPEANRMATITVKRIAKKGTVLLKARMKSGDASALGDSTSVSLSVLYGDSEGVFDCSSGRNIPCVSKGAKLDCRR